MKTLITGGTATALALALGFAAVDTAQAQSAPPAPPGASAQIAQGAQLYQQHCALCHGVSGRDATVFPRPIWGTGHDIAKFGNAKGLFEYLQLMMPFDDPSRLDDAQKTAISAYILVRNGNLPADATLPTGGSGATIK
ncbi:MAG: cytochrome c [Burkholderiaceae bacterium]|jgi:mono/diheme cytochrome c family protein|nr:cytochrome c [Burkholderiaceae bacterium]